MSVNLSTAETSPISFAESESKVTGVLTSIRHVMPEKIRDACHKERQMEYDNAPRIVGTLKLGGDILCALAAPVMIGYAAFAMTGRLIMIAWGSKANQKKMAAKHAQDAEKLATHSWGNNAKKILHPREYPVEASSGLSVLAELFETSYGATPIFRGQMPNISPLIVGLVALWSYGHIMFAKEKKKGEPDKPPENDPPSLTFAKSESKPVGIAGRLWKKLRDNPVLASSIVNIGISTIMVLAIFQPGASIYYVAAGAVFIFANIIQAALVRKSDFNIEGAAQEAQEQPPTSFQDRIARQRDQGGQLGVQPA